MIRVSSVLSHLFPGAFDKISFSTLKIATERGSYYHALAAALMLSIQFPEAHPFNEEKYKDDYHIVRSIREWAQQYGVQPLLVEQRQIHKVLGYCGTPDLFALFHCPVFPLWHQKKVLVDFKFTASIMEQNKIQVVAYSHLPKYSQADKIILLNINPYTGARNIHEVFRKGNGYWIRFCQGLSEMQNLLPHED